MKTEGGPLYPGGEPFHTEGTVDEDKVLNLSSILTEQRRHQGENGGKLTIPLNLVSLNQQIRTPEQATMAANALRAVATLLDGGRGVVVDP